MALQYYRCCYARSLQRNKNQYKQSCRFASATGSAGTIAAGDYLRTQFPHIKVAASEALQCPTLLMNGFGGHRIEGIGDKHVPWIHNVKNTNAVVAIDDEDCMRILRLFNEKDGIEYLINQGVPKEIAQNLHLLGISGISNMLTAIKMAKYYEMTSDDVIMTVATDSADMYQSRLVELRAERGNYNPLQAAKDHEKCMLGAKTDYIRELTYQDQKMIHNLKYFTWVEQQAKEIEDLNQLWYDRNIWHQLFNQTESLDKLIEEFNKETGVIDKL
jgi:Cysteine synthase